MNGRRRAVACFWLLSLLSCAALAGAGCANQVGLIDRTQAGLLRKSLFDGEWFLRRTVVEVPYDVGYTFIGEQEEVIRARWEIQRDLLLAYRVYPQVEGTPDAAAVAVFKIEKHVDVIREYNEATGEQNNVLVENDEDRLWYEREYIRVDWSQNLVKNFNFTVDTLDQEAVAYHLGDPTDPDSLLIGVKDDDGAWQDFQDPKTIQLLREAQYIDVVTKVFLTPEEIWVEDDWGEVWTEPACWYYLNYDCAPAVIDVRSSFLRVDAALSDYEPLVYPDNQIALDDEGAPIRVRWTASGDRERLEDDAGGAAGPAGDDQVPPWQGPQDPYATQDESIVRLPFFDKFGYFRVERYGYDPLYGEVEGARTYYANRWNIWAKSHAEDGSVLPYAERGFRPIVYYLSPDFPTELEPYAFKAVDRWNEAFRATARAVSGEEPPRLFELRRNTRQVDPETGRVIRRGEVNGDLRYSHLWLVQEPTRAGLLGYGPSAADPLTGELFAGDAYIYGAPARELAARGRDIVDLLNGRLDPEDLAEGRHVQAYLAMLEQRAAGGESVPPPTTEAVRRFAQAHPGPDVDSAASEGKARSKRPPRADGRGTRLPELERLRRPAGWATARLEQARGTALEDLLMADDAIRLLKGAGLDPDMPTSALPAGLRERLSPVRWASPQHRRESLDRMRGWAKRNMLMAFFYDDAVAGLALELKDMESQAALDYIDAMLFRATSEHEIGHTLGLRHNFEASTDALNFHPEYWSLRGDHPVPMAQMTVGERDGRLREYQYSSIMDYAGRFNTDSAGLGYYDMAAIKFAYGGLVQVFENPPAEPLLGVTDYGEGSDDRPFSFDDVLRRYRHYTKIPSMFGGAAGIADRRDVPYTAEDARRMGRDAGDAYAAQLTGDAPWRYWEVPYRFCSDEYEFGTGTCLMFDLGADRYEIVHDAIDRYWNYYWFNNFKRDRVLFDEWDYMDTIWWRYFAFVQNAYQNWAFDQWFVSDVWEWLRDDAKTWEVEDAPWREAVDAGLTGTAAVMDGVRFLQQVLAIPEPGAYMYDFYEDYYWALSEDPLPLCPAGTWSYDSAEWCADVNLGLGEGRWFYSRYDWDSGYYFYERLKWVGTFYDKMLALEALTSPDTYFLGVNTFEAVDEWAISMYLFFPDEIQKTFAGIAADRFDLFAGVVTEDGKHLAPDPFAFGAAADLRANGKPVDPYTSFTMQLYSLWYGMAWLNANFDSSFNDGAKIWLKGSGEAIDTTAMEPTQVVEFTSPLNGRTYVTLRPSEPKSTGLGALMLEQANKFKSEYEEYRADPTADAGTLEYLRWRVENIQENIEVVRGLYDLYGYLYF